MATNHDSLHVDRARDARRGSLADSRQRICAAAAAATANVHRAPSRCRWRNTTASPTAPNVPHAGPIRRRSRPSSHAPRRPCASPAARARGTFTLEGEVFHTGVTRVPLTVERDHRRRALGSTTLPLLREGEMSVALVEGPRPFSIVVDWGADVTSAPGRASLAMPVPMAGSVRASFELPGTVADVRLEPGAITRTAAAAGITHVEATLVPAARPGCPGPRET